MHSGHVHVHYNRFQPFVYYRVSSESTDTVVLVDWYRSPLCAEAIRTTSTMLSCYLTSQPLPWFQTSLYSMETLHRSHPSTKAFASVGTSGTSSLSSSALLSPCSVEQVSIPFYMTGYLQTPGRKWFFDITTPAMISDISIFHGNTSPQPPIHKGLRFCRDLRDFIFIIFRLAISMFSRTGVYPFLYDRVSSDSREKVVLWHHNPCHDFRHLYIPWKHFTAATHPQRPSLL